DVVANIDQRIRPQDCQRIAGRGGRPAYILRPGHGYRVKKDLGQRVSRPADEHSDAEVTGGAVGHDATNHVVRKPARPISRRAINNAARREGRGLNHPVYSVARNRGVHDLVIGKGRGSDRGSTNADTKHVRASTGADIGDRVLGNLHTVIKSDQDAAAAEPGCTGSANLVASDDRADVLIRGTGALVVDTELDRGDVVVLDAVVVVPRSEARSADGAAAKTDASNGGRARVAGYVQVLERIVGRRIGCSNRLAPDDCTGGTNVGIGDGQVSRRPAGRVGSVDGDPVRAVEKEYRRRGRCERADANSGGRGRLDRHRIYGARPWIRVERDRECFASGPINACAGRITRISQEEGYRSRLDPGIVGCRGCRQGWESSGRTDILRSADGWSAGENSLGKETERGRGRARADHWGGDRAPNAGVSPGLGCRLTNGIRSRNTYLGQANGGISEIRGPCRGRNRPVAIGVDA